MYNMGQDLKICSWGPNWCNCKLYFHDGTEQSLPYIPEPRRATKAATAIFNVFNFRGWTGPPLLNAARLSTARGFYFPLAGLSHSIHYCVRTHTQIGTEGETERVRVS